MRDPQLADIDRQWQIVVLALTLIALAGIGGVLLVLVGGEL